MSEPGNLSKMMQIYRRRKAARPAAPERLYETIARKLVQEMREGKYAIGDRLPAERELAAEHGISRPAVREALLALEVFGLIEVRIGSGAYVISLPDNVGDPAFAVSAFELMEARVLIEGEAAALAAQHISAAELDALDNFVAQIGAANQQGGAGEGPDEAFHRLIAKASRNKAMELAVGNLWDLRSTSPDCALLHEKARTANVAPVVDEHSAILQALRAHDPDGARRAMRAHLSQVIEHLLFAIEQDAVEQARASVANTRRRYLQGESG